MRVDIGNKEFKKKVLDPQQMFKQDEQILAQDHQIIEDIDGKNQFLGLKKDYVEVVVQVVLAAFVIYTIYQRHNARKEAEVKPAVKPEVKPDLEAEPTT
ncbi:hypothetical protein AN639_01055 [Candidatus Epulonipiscium fishelsonii]|uniref:Uncharacterized protein n=1 Tax=Candidatus Epulonipiscium fishelsonii TaxID=77094 RepID=A0ACC8X7L4_9FIRM|nr:hypothetical protein AN396_12190 [Epulopiscium sp. SCG-B11WGA-EpuloA1]ONI40697.1 hypothetical protein AN639_01055 [Epulopiscium sp. SCG-B05WGA-EpuloA1]